MKKINTSLLSSYEENIILDAQITAILSSKSSAFKKRKDLNKLQESAITPLAKAHVKYYQKQLSESGFTALGRILSAPLVIAYFFLIIYRIYFVLYPDKPHYNSIPLLSELDLIEWIIITPLVILVYYLLRYFLSLDKENLFAFICIAGMFGAILFGCHINYKTRQSSAALTVESSSPEAIAAADTPAGETETVTEISAFNAFSEYFSGEWTDIHNQQCWLTVVPYDGCLFKITIHCPTGTSESTEWFFTGHLDDSASRVLCSGIQFRTIEYTNQTAHRKTVSSNELGLFYFDSDNNLRWKNLNTGEDEEYIFQKTS